MTTDSVWSLYPDWVVLLVPSNKRRHKYELKFHLNSENGTGLLKSHKGMQNIKFKYPVLPSDLSLQTRNYLHIYFNKSGITTIKGIHSYELDLTFPDEKGNVFVWDKQLSRHRYERIVGWISMTDAWRLFRDRRSLQNYNFVALIEIEQVMEKLTPLNINLINIVLKLLNSYEPLVPWDTEDWPELI